MSEITNARDELIREVGDRRVAYGKVVNGYFLSERGPVVSFGSHEEYLAALPALNFEYDAGYGCQELFGCVVFEDGTWLERHEYDGAENWTLKTQPSREEVAAYNPGQWT